jgi:hypothetical protein
MCHHRQELKDASDRTHKLKVKLALRLLDERVSALEEAFMDLAEYHEEEDEEENEESEELEEDQDEDEDEKSSCSRCRC